MARKPAKPWFRSDRNAWFVCLRGKQISLGPDKEEAQRRFHGLMAEKPSAQVSSADDEALTVAEVIEKFLDWCQRHRAAETYVWYMDRLQSFLDFFPKLAHQPVTALKPFHIVEWADKHTSWGDSHRRGAIIAIQRPFNWAAKLGYIGASPVRHVEKPEATRRENPLTPKQFSELIDQVKDQPFRDLLTFRWLTGCRPQEARRIEARHVNLERRRIELSPKEAKGKKRWRIIYLNEQALTVVHRLMALYPSGPLFRNTKGRPWQTFAICNRFGRLKKRLGRRWAAYDLRHSFANRMLKELGDPITVAALLGHKDATMLCKYYEHVSTSDDHLHEAVRKASNGDA